MGFDCFVDDLQLALGGMSERGWTDEGMRAVAVQGFLWEVTVTGSSNGTETHTSQSQTVS